MFKIKSIFNLSARFYASANKIRPVRKPKVIKKIESAAISLQAKGFLRSQIEYNPPQDVEEKISAIAKDLGVSDLKAKKFDFLDKCAITFNGHQIPNSRIYEMKTIQDVIEFYCTRVDIRTPYEELANSELVPNLHIIPHAHRYNPETDGVSAFPKSSTLVTGIKTRKVYKGHIAKTSWP